MKDKITSEVGLYYVDDLENEVGYSNIKDPVGRRAKGECNIRKKSIVKINCNQARGEGAHCVCVSSANPRSKLVIVLSLKFFALSITLLSPKPPATIPFLCLFHIVSSSQQLILGSLVSPKFLLHPIKIEGPYNVFPVFKLWQSKVLKLCIPSSKMRHSQS
ncbi:hypothetical protein M9H77_04522 [Catharanthus roseus]|uniref:Uncharacterized protein n=1 Tax=Catharanthus roseus TaxID=4058 RepID=A0ACC0CET0_CATRO|nr:hypothetical protein M9H77_04522 [Catharanthus roseus]